MAQSGTLYLYQYFTLAGAFQIEFLDNHWL
jgi:hypothetical protein